jgi:hypothetical protein
MPDLWVLLDHVDELYFFDLKDKFEVLKEYLL